MQIRAQPFFDADLYIAISLGGLIKFNMNDKFDIMLRKIIDTPEFNRTMNIPQLGFVEWTFCSANHTRYVHNASTMYLMREMIRRAKINDGISTRDARKFTLDELAGITAGLLHDIGHTFPGHPLEGTMRAVFGKSIKDHEAWGMEIIQRSKISNILNSYSPGFANKVLDIMSGNNLENNRLQQILHGNCNADTIDYLLRDQFRTNYECGFDRVNARRIINHIKFGKTSAGNDCVILGRGSEQDFIKMLTARAEMYSGVYFGREHIGAEAFLPTIFEGIIKALDSPKLKPMLQTTDFHRLQNPFIKFIESKGTDYDAYLRLNHCSFYMMMEGLGKLGIKGLSDLAQRYENVGLNFSSHIIYMGDPAGAPDESEIHKAKKQRGVIKTINIRYYDTRKSEVYCVPDGYAQPIEFSKAYPDIAGKQVKIISESFARRSR